MSRYSDLIRADHPALYYRMGADELTDLSGNGRNGSYSNGRLLVPGLIAADSDQASSLNGTDQYVATPWTTRTNLDSNPSAANNTTDFLFTAGEGTRVTSLPSGGDQPRATTGMRLQGVANADQVRKNNYAVVSGTTYTWSVWVYVASLTATRVELYVANAANTAKASQSTLTGGTGSWRRWSITFTADATENWRFGVRQIGVGASDFYTTQWMQEVAPSLGSYFDGDIESYGAGDSGWSGTAGNSSSQVGPFANGTDRTFEIWVNRLNSATYDARFGSSISQGAYMELGSGGNNVLFDPQNGGASVAWNGSAVAPGSIGHYVLTWRENADLAELVVNAVSQGTRVPTDQHALLPSTLQVAGFAGADIFGGVVDEAAVYERILTPSEWQSHYKAGIGESAPVQILVSEPIPDRLAVRIEPYGGSPARWADDSGLDENVIDEITCSDEMPGGYKEASGVLARNPQLQWPDVDAYAEVTVYEPGVEEVYAGRLGVAPAVSGEQVSISPVSDGWQAALEDDNAVRLPVINSDITQWQAASTQRSINLGTGWGQVDGETTTDLTTGYPAIKLKLTSPWSLAQNVSEMWLDAGVGQAISAIFYDVLMNGFLSTDPNLLFRMISSQDDVASGAIPSGDLKAATTGYFTPSTAQRWMYAQLQYLAAHTSDSGIDYPSFFRRPVAYGALGVGTRGGTDPKGFFAKDILSYAVPKLAAPLTFAADSDDDLFVIMQAWYNDPTNMGEIVKDVMKYGLYDWFVGYNGPHTMEVRNPGTYGRKWKTTVRECDLNETGLDASRLWKSVVVSYQDVDGTTKTVGPPGAPVDTTDPSLVITDPDHPAMRAPVTRRDLVQLQGISNYPSAITVGQQFLAEANQLSHSGSATLSGYVLDDVGTLRPAAQVHSGDWLSVVDAADTSYRKIVGKSYTHSERSAAVDLDAPPDGLSALLERLQVDLVPLGLG